MKKCLSANTLKIIAVTAMLIDHIAWCFVDTYSVLGQIMHIIGRMTAPIMCYFIAEGYHYTRNCKKYLLRLGIFAVISWFPYVLMEYGKLPIYIENDRIYLIYKQGVIFTFFLGLLSLMIIHSDRLHIAFKIALMAIILPLSLIGDWFVFAVLWIIAFDLFRGNYLKQVISFTVIAVLFVLYLQFALSWSFTESLFQFGVLLALIPLYFYNGEKGRSGRFWKWFFYIFYPVHAFILGLLKLIIAR